MSGLMGLRRIPLLPRVAVVTLVTVVALAGCSVGTPMGGRHMDGTGPRTSRSTGFGMPGNAMMTMTRDEADYLVTMVAHHREAIVASAELTRSAHPELRELGRTIRRTQSDQVRLMERWIDRWYPQATPSVPYQPMMSDLSALTGDDLDRTFLTEMIHHHMMAVMMSRQLERSGLVRHQVVAGLAESVIEEQSAEIVLMRQWLREWGLW